MPGILDTNNDARFTLRPMRYPQFYDYYLDAIKNTWRVEEISFNTDAADIREKLSPAEHHVVSRLVAFFASADGIVNDNLVLNLYKHINSPEARMYYSRQIFEEALHVQFYLTLLDNYLPDDNERYKSFAAIHNIPSIKKKADFCFKWIDGITKINTLDTTEKQQQFLMNLITFAAAIEGCFFFGAFAYVYYLRSKGLLHGLASGTNWVFRDETMHIDVAFEIVRIVRQEYPHLWTSQMEHMVIAMMEEAVGCEYQFAEDVLQLGVAGMSKNDMLTYLKFTADRRLTRLGIKEQFGGKNPFPFIDLQGMDENTNFFERTVASYSVATQGVVSFDTDF